MWPSPQFPVDLVQLTEEIHNEKLHFLFAQWVRFSRNRNAEPWKFMKHMLIERREKW